LTQAVGADLSFVSRTLGIGLNDVIPLCEWASLGAFTILLQTSTDAFDSEPRVHLALLGPARNMKSSLGTNLSLPLVEP